MNRGWTCMKLMGHHVQILHLLLLENRLKATLDCGYSTGPMAARHHTRLRAVQLRGRRGEGKAAHPVLPAGRNRTDPAAPVAKSNVRPWLECLGAVT